MIKLPFKFKLDNITALSIIFVGGITALYSFISPPIYKASLQISIDPGSVASMLTRNVDSWQTYVDEQARGIKNKELLDKMVEKLHLKFSRKFAGQDPASIIKKRVKAGHIRGTNIISIDVYMDDPDLASKIALGLAESFISARDEKKFALTKEAIAWFKEGNDVSKRIDESKEALNKFVAENKATLLKERLEKAKEALADLTRQRDQKSALAKELGRRLEEIESSLNNSGMEKAIYMLKDNSNIVEMRSAKEQAEAKISKLKTVYEETHPEIVRLRKEIAEIDKNMEAVVYNMVSSDSAELVLTKKQISSLSKEIDELDKRIERMKVVEVKLDDLTRKLDIAQKFYDEFLGRLKEGRFSLVDVTNLGLLGQQETLTKPVGPKKARNITLGILIGFIGGKIASLIMKNKKKILKSEEL